MATFNVVGFDDVIKGLEAASEDYKRVAIIAAEAGAKAAVKCMERTVPVRTGILKGSLQYKGPNFTFEKGHYFDVFPSGFKKNGRKKQRIEEVGFVLEYGKSNTPAMPWMRTAVEEGEPEIVAAMAEALKKEGYE